MSVILASAGLAAACVLVGAFILAGIGLVPLAVSFVREVILPPKRNRYVSR